MNVTKPPELCLWLCNLAYVGRQSVVLIILSSHKVVPLGVNLAFDPGRLVADLVHEASSLCAHVHGGTSVAEVKAGDREECARQEGGLVGGRFRRCSASGHLGCGR